MQLFQATREMKQDGNVEHAIETASFITKCLVQDICGTGSGEHQRLYNGERHLGDLEHCVGAICALSVGDSQSIKPLCLTQASDRGDIKLNFIVDSFQVSPFVIQLKP